MHIFDILDAWLHSMNIFLKNSGATVHLERAPLDSPNQFYALNIRRNEREADLIAWESGEAELMIGTVGESVNQTHFDDIRTHADLSKLFTQIAEFVARN
jgi:hypothetical protein